MADHEITRLRQLLEESERRREEEQRRREEEQRRREEEQRRREEADRRREEEQRRREEADRQRDEAEILASAARPQTVPDYLESCHRLSLAIEIVTDKTLTTQGEVTKPTGRKFPRRIIPWENFAASQEKTWNLLAADDAFFADRVCPSLNQLDYVASLNAPISSEIGLRNFQRDTVENAVERLLTEVYNNPHLRTRLDMQGSVKFESHTNLGPDNESISEHLDNLTIDGATTTGAAAPRRRAVGRGNRRADQFCIYRTESGQSYPSLAIEYKAPHKLSRDQVVAGLAAEIQPDRDVINKDGEGFDFESRRLCAAVVTQLFSYMIGLGTPYGYVCTGEVFIFLHIHPSDPSMVYYSVQVPNLDVMDDDETRLHRTAVSQVFAFVLRAIREEPPPQVWFDATEDFATWAVEYEKVLGDVPATARKPPRDLSYKPQRWKGFTRSPINTRYRTYCIAMGDSVSHEDEDDDSDSPSPTPHPPASSTRVTRSSQRARTRGDEQVQRRGTHGQNIRQRQYCTHQCLHNLVFGGAIDKSCPNAKDHGHAQLGLEEFLCRIHMQLATDRGRDSNCMPLGLSGLHGSLFKVRLSDSGYTLVAKGAEAAEANLLRHERRIYDRLRGMQGTQIPVCLGILDLALPFYFDGRICTSFLFLSYAGRPLNHITAPVGPGIVAKVTETLAEMHNRGVLHQDAEPRNVLWDGNRVMIVDFERAATCERATLGPISPNGTRKRKRTIAKHGHDPFAQEIESTRVSVGRVVEELATRCM